jgi:hypothetical protein
VPSNLMMELRQSGDAMSGARPPGQAWRLLLADRHGNEMVHFGKSIRVPPPWARCRPMPLRDMLHRRAISVANKA